MDASSMMVAGVRADDDVFAAVDEAAQWFGDVEFGGARVWREYVDGGDVEALADAELRLEWGSVALA